VGFATRSWQMDSVAARINRLYGRKISDIRDDKNIRTFTSWKTVICPHDDYTYASWLYPLTLQNVKTPTVILIGVAHKAGKYGIENKMVFDSYDFWKAPYGPVRVSGLREKIMNQLPRSTYLVSDSLHQAEHSLEALVPWLQYFYKGIEIVPILVPYMSFKTMDDLARNLSLALMKLCQDGVIARNRDITIVISNDAVHYGDEDWGGTNYAFYGNDSAAYVKAIAHENEIISKCLTGEITKEKLRRFSEYTVQDTNYRTYKWTWCGRYAVPFGLLTACYLEQKMRSGPLVGTLLGYSTSIAQPALRVEDLGMGKTAEATLHHWVGFVGIGYR
jgi:AmmeMemoRadiSam system protein B